MSICTRRRGRRKGWGTVAAVTLLMASPVAAQAPLEVHISYTQFTLQNGLTVLLHEDPTLPLVSVNLWYHVGSRDERRGRTGFAHLFEHIMFEGSKHVPGGEFDTRLEAVGASNNGSTSWDRTNYWINAPKGALALALWLEADRMGWLLDTMDREKLDIQRAVVQNERRQSYENQPYGMAWETTLAALFPPEHPYSWPVIGRMPDLEAAGLDDVVDFFRRWYAPNNAVLAVAGDVSLAEVQRLTARYFGEIPRGPEITRPTIPTPTLDEPRILVLEDDVQLPRLYITWHAPLAYSTDDALLDLAARILADGKSSRLHRTLVYEEKVAQEVEAFQYGGAAGGIFQIVVTGVPNEPLGPLAERVRGELEAMAGEGIEIEELERTRNQVETDFVQGLESVGGFGGKADQLNEYFFYTGNPGFIRHDLNRFRGATPEAVREAVDRLLVGSPAVTLSVVPRGRVELAVPEATP